MGNAYRSVANRRNSAIHASSSIDRQDLGRPRLSACIITLDEADRIGRCLSSLDFCDDLVVLDSGSTDSTAEIARSHGARVIVRPFSGYRSQKQAAIDAAMHDWVLCLDADEWIDPDLRRSILVARDASFRDVAGYRFARLSDYFGRSLRHGNAYPDRVLRLFDRRRGGWRGQREVHERVSVDGRVATLAGDLRHTPYRSLTDQLAKTERYARMMAEHDHAKGKRASLAKLVLAPAWRFWRGYVLRGGFLDGWHGLVYAYVRANYVRQKTIMLWLLEHGQPLATQRADLSVAEDR